MRVWPARREVAVRPRSRPAVHRLHWTAHWSRWWRRLAVRVDRTAAGSGGWAERGRAGSFSRTGMAPTVAEPAAVPPVAGDWSVDHGSPWPRSHGRNATDPGRFHPVSESHSSRVTRPPDGARRSSDIAGTGPDRPAGPGSGHAGGPPAWTGVDAGEPGPGAVGGFGSGPDQVGGPGGPGPGPDGPGARAANWYTSATRASSGPSTMDELARSGDVRSPVPGPCPRGASGSAWRDGPGALGPHASAAGSVWPRRSAAQRPGVDGSGAPAWPGGVPAQGPQPGRSGASGSAWAGGPDGPGPGLHASAAESAWPGGLGAQGSGSSGSGTSESRPPGGVQARRPGPYRWRMSGSARPGRWAAPGSRPNAPEPGRCAVPPERDADFAGDPTTGRRGSGGSGSGTDESAPRPSTVVGRHGVGSAGAGSSLRREGALVPEGAGLPASGDPDAAAGSTSPGRDAHGARSSVVEPPGAGRLAGGAGAGGSGSAASAPADGEPGAGNTAGPEQGKVSPLWTARKPPTAQAGSGSVLRPMWTNGDGRSIDLGSPAGPGQDRMTTLCGWTAGGWSQTRNATYPDTGGPADERWPRLPDESPLWTTEARTGAHDDHVDLLDREQRGVRWNG